MKNAFSILLIFSLIVVLSDSCSKSVPTRYEKKEVSLTDELAKAYAESSAAAVNTEVHEDFNLSLWATDSLVHDPVAISIDPLGGIYYTRAIRMSNSEFDIRGHREWMIQSISWQTVEDRKNFLRSNFPEDGTGQNEKLEDLNNDGKKDWHDLAVQKEEVWRISDESGDGYADKAVRYLEDFHEEFTDVANGVEYHDGEVYVTCAPDLWKTKDVDGDGIADEVESLAHGFAIHIGFGGHGLSGVIMGPDGRLWWGIGDIGMNLIDKEGKQWRYPNQGVIVRCEPDGSNFEVYAAGLRNTHEFTFDKYGNLITEDNDGDHSGERERLVFLINGSDSGWRTNWQFGKYTDPKNNEYKVWTEEKLHIPAWEGQAAYILPPIMNYVNGPTGFVYNPGTALSPRWKDHFFVAEFRGTPTRSPIHAFTLEPEGASFKLGSTTEVVKGVLPTGIDFSADGAMYFADWIEGWDTKRSGRIWKLDVKDGKNSAIREDTKKWLTTNFSEVSSEELQLLIGHEDMRVRQKAQFEFVKRPENQNQLVQIAENNENQLARVHAIWGLGQLIRNGKYKGEILLELLEDEDEEIVAQALKMIGDVRIKDENSAILSFINHDNPRLQLMSTEAAGRLEKKEALPFIIEMLEKNDNKDKWLRHAGMVALSRIGVEDALENYYNHPSVAVRIAAVVALRRMQSEKIQKFLNDREEFIVTEAARAINDDFSIPGALPALAELLNSSKFRNEALVRRMINAHARLGQPENLQELLDYASDQNAPEEMRAEAIAAASVWTRPSVLDRVDGRFRGEIIRDSLETIKILTPYVTDLMVAKQSSIQVATIKLVANQGLLDYASEIVNIFNRTRSVELKITSLEALHQLNYAELPDILQKAVTDRRPEVVAKVIELIPSSDLSEEQSIPLIVQALNSSDVEVQQSAISSLAAYDNAIASKTLANLINDLQQNDLNPALELDLIEAVEAAPDTTLRIQLEEVYAQNDDPLARYLSALEGGEHWNGRRIFNNHAGAQCTRCHTVFEFGGDAGPSLGEVGSRLSKREILESLVYPSQQLAAGYGAASLTLSDGSKVAGIIQAEGEASITLKVGDEIRQFNNSEIQERNDLPSSMPSMKDILTLREIRDVVAYLSRLKGEES